jgi:hypothetical protein
MDDNQPQAPSTTNINQAAPPSPSQQYTETMQWNLDHQDQIIQAHADVDPQLAAIQSGIKAQTAEAGVQSYLDLYNKYGAQLGEANQGLANAFDPLSDTRTNFIKDQVGNTDNFVADQYQKLYDDNNFQDRSLVDALKAKGMENINLGGSLNPEFSAQLEEAARTAATSRGQYYSPASVYAELLTKGKASEDLRTNRLNQAMSISGLVQQADAFGLEGRTNLLRQLGTEKLQGPASKAAILGLSSPTRLGEATGAMQAGYQPFSVSSGVADFANINNTSSIYKDIAGYNSDIYKTQAGIYGTQMDHYKSTMDQIGQGVDIAGGLMGTAAMGAMI